MERTRRDVLQTGAGLAGTGILAGLAGCNSLPIIGSGGGGAFYRSDLYEPGTVSDRSHYAFNAFRPATIAQNEDQFDSATYDDYESFIEDQLFSAHGLDIDDIETLTTIDNGAVSVATGSYNTDDVVSAIEDAGFEDETETDSGYTIYLNPNNQTCTAISGSAIFTMHDPSALSAGPPIRVQDSGSGQSGETSGATGLDRNVQNLRSISMGETVQSQLDQSDPSGRRGHYEPVTFQGQSGTTVDIRMQSEPGDTFLMLQNPDGNVVARNDDAESLNSRIVHTLQSSGQYTIIATSFGSGATFPYQLTLSEVTGDLRSISYGESLTGRIDGNDPTGHRGNYEPVTFTGSEGDVVRINMSSGGDTYLMLQNPSGTVVAENDDTNGLNSQISHTLQSSGEYTIIATSFNENAQFVYNLALELQFSPNEMLSAVEAMTGVKSGNTARYVEAVDAASSLVSAIGGGTIVSGLTTEPVQRDQPANGYIESMVARGYSVQVNGEQSDVTGAAVFESDGDADAGDVADWVESTGTLSEAEDLSESTSGRTATVQGVIDTDEL